MPVRGSTGSLLPRQSCVEGRWPWWLVVPAAPDDPAQHRSDHHAATIQDLRDRLCGARPPVGERVPQRWLGPVNSLELAAQCRGVLKPGAPPTRCSVSNPRAARAGTCDRDRQARNAVARPTITTAARRPASGFDPRAIHCTAGIA
jgi:hypothetical protein